MSEERDFEETISPVSEGVQVYKLDENSDYEVGEDDELYEKVSDKDLTDDQIELRDLMEIIMKSEEKHGREVHIQIESIEPFGGEKDDEMPMGGYWVEFENKFGAFSNLEDVKEYLLETAVATGEGPKVTVRTYDEPDW
jgi:hypothetical protein